MIISYATLASLQKTWKSLFKTVKTNWNYYRYIWIEFEMVMN